MGCNDESWLVGRPTLALACVFVPALGAASFCKYEAEATRAALY